MLNYLLFLLLATPAFALPENELELLWKDKAYSYFISTPLESFKNQQGMNVTYRSYTHPANTKSLVILPGRTEPAVKYAELIYDLRLKGFDIHILDHQGQGESDRLLNGSQKGHVRYFSDYVKDVHHWMSQTVAFESAGKDLYLLAHSMGGAISVKFLNAYPGVFKKAVLSAPMMEVNTKPYSEKVATILSGLLVKLGLGKKYAPDRGPYLPEKDIFETNEATYSKARWAVSKFIFTEWSELVVGGPTSRWVRESLRVTKNIDRLGLKISTPILLLQAGKDQIVNLPRQTAFCQKAPNCKLIHYSEARHEILMEKDEVRNAAIKEILAFF